MRRLSYFDFVPHLYVEDPITGHIGPMQLYSAQRDFARAILEDRDALGRRCYRRGVFSIVKKAGKTGLAASMALYLLLFDEFETSREVYSIANDLDQARLIWKAGRRMIRRSPMLQAFERAGTLRVLKDEIIFEDEGAAGVFRCLASDTKGLHGIAPSALLCDETWTQQDYDLLEACALPPTRRCPVELHFSYAGLKAQQVEGNPLWDLFRHGQARTDPKLFFFYASGLEANRLVPWIADEYLEERRLSLPSNKFKRLHMNQWGAGDAQFVTDGEIRRALVDPRLQPIRRDHSARWCVSVDYGRSHDMTAIAVARMRDDQVVQLAELTVLSGSREHPVPLEAVEDVLLSIQERFNVDQVAADPWQMQGSVERLKKAGLRIEEQPIGPAYLNQITTTFLSLMRSGRFQSYYDAQLESQLEAVIVRETFYGIRIDSGAGAGVRAHDDLVIACAMVAELALSRAGKGQGVAVIRVGDQARLAADLAHCARLDAAKRAPVRTRAAQAETAHHAAMVGKYGEAAVAAVLRLSR